MKETRPSNALYVIGGQQRTARSLWVGNQDWDGYQKGLILLVDPLTAAVNIHFEYVSPPEVYANENSAISFQASTIQGTTLYTCTQTEVLIYTLPQFKQIGYISLPHFNDVHHVRPTPKGNILVANAGLEMVLEITQKGEVRRIWNVLGEDPWAKFSPNIDYRKVASTKPHRSHPNYVFYINDQIWATRFHQGDAICLNNPERRIYIGSERIHDGVVYGNYVYFTVVSGKVVVANIETLQVEEIIDLNTLHAENAILGWCRSIYIQDDLAWIGFSRIRPTRFRGNVSWVVRGFKQDMPTHIACYDLRRRRHIVDIDLEHTGLAAVYSIFPAIQ